MAVKSVSIVHYVFFSTCRPSNNINVTVMSVIFVEVLFFRFSLSSHRATLLLPLLCTHESSQDCINDVDDYKHAMELNTWSADILYKHMNLNRALTLYIYNVVLSDIFIIWLLFHEIKIFKLCQKNVNRLNGLKVFRYKYEYTNRV